LLWHEFCNGFKGPDLPTDDEFERTVERKKARMKDYKWVRNIIHVAFYVVTLALGFVIHSLIVLGTHF
jgi:hypothetical protein